MVNHVGIIMDGNGRWATLKKKSRIEGHTKGAEVCLEIVRHSCLKKIPFLTLYTLSIQNLKRPESEIKHIIKLVKQEIPNILNICLENNAKIVVVGDRSYFDEELKDMINSGEDKTKNNSDTQVSMCLFYDGRQEILEACKNGNITQESISKNILPDVDLIIRSGGEHRLSNFLLWQSAYAELFFTKTLWPDFTIDEFEKILKDFEMRNRTFGEVVEIPDIHSVYECFEILINELKNETRYLDDLYSSIQSKPVVKFHSKNEKRNDFFVKSALCSEDSIKFSLEIDDIIDHQEKQVAIDYKKILSDSFSEDTLHKIDSSLIDKYRKLSHVEKSYLQNMYKCDYLQLTTPNKEIWRYCSIYYFIKFWSKNFLDDMLYLLLAINVAFVDDIFDEEEDFDELRYINEGTYSIVSGALFNLHDNNVNLYLFSLNDLIYAVSSIVLKKNKFENISEISHYLTSS